MCNRPRSAVYPTPGLWQAPGEAGQEDSIGLELEDGSDDDDGDGEDLDDVGDDEGDGGASAEVAGAAAERSMRGASGGRERMSEEMMQGSEGASHSSAVAGGSGMQSPGGSPGGGEIDISHSFSALSSGAVSEEDRPTADGDTASHHATVGDDEPEPVLDRRENACGSASGCEGGVIGAGGASGGGVAGADGASQSVVEAGHGAASGIDVVIDGEDDVQKRGIEVNSGVQGVGGGGAASKELLLHGFAAWCPFQVCPLPCLLRFGDSQPDTVRQACLLLAIDLGHIQQCFAALSIASSGGC